MSIKANELELFVLRLLVTAALQTPRERTLLQHAAHSAFWLFCRQVEGLNWGEPSPARVRTRTFEELYSLVTDAILKAEAAERRGDKVGTLAAYWYCSCLEEEIADQLPATSAEGLVARRGAVRAAINAEQYPRVIVLAERYRKDVRAPAELIVWLAYIQERARTALRAVAAIDVEIHPCRTFRLDGDG